MHTADWHIGQLFHEYDRTYEHQQFLNWLLETIINEHVDVLLVSGDIFDLSNPSAASVKMFYSFLNQTVKDLTSISQLQQWKKDNSALQSIAENHSLISSKLNDAQAMLDVAQSLLPQLENTQTSIAEAKHAKLSLGQIQGLLLKTYRQKGKKHTVGSEELPAILII